MDKTRVTLAPSLKYNTGASQAKELSGLTNRQWERLKFWIREIVEDNFIGQLWTDIKSNQSDLDMARRALDKKVEIDGSDSVAFKGALQKFTAPSLCEYLLRTRMLDVNRKRTFAAFQSTPLPDEPSGRGSPDTDAPEVIVRRQTSTYFDPVRDGFSP
ncbi:MAG: hypothetical protein M1824_005153 [Vezdaea acicularis]|nr:MAG: hypothetical protein M1824_005153 [Vezdaea acicularis]